MVRLTLGFSQLLQTAIDVTLKCVVFIAMVTVVYMYWTESNIVTHQLLLLLCWITNSFQMNADCVILKSQGCCKVHEQLISICEPYAQDFHIIFNPAKSKLFF